MRRLLVALLDTVKESPATLAALDRFMRDEVRRSWIYRVSQKKVGSQKTSNCSNSLNFEAKIKCNTIKPNVPKWRKTCTGLKFDLLDFYGPQSNIHTF